LHCRGSVGDEGFAVDASLIQADASDRNRVEGAAGLPPEAAGRAVEEYLAVLDDAAFGAALEHFDLYPERLIGDSAHGSAEMLNWLVHDRGIEPHIPAFDIPAHRRHLLTRRLLLRPHY
jgi:hypothetical protein